MKSAAGCGGTFRHSMHKFLRQKTPAIPVSIG
jgi:hypothetical protein